MEYLYYLRFAPVITTSCNPPTCVVCMCWWALCQLPKILKLVSSSWRLRQLFFMHNVQIITVTMAMSIEQYNNQRCHQECDFNPEGQRLLWNEEQWAILVNLLFYIHGGFIRTTHCVHNLLQASYQPSPALEILISYVYFTLHPLLPSSNYAPCHQKPSKQ